MNFLGKGFYQAGEIVVFKLGASVFIGTDLFPAVEGADRIVQVAVADIDRLAFCFPLVTGGIRLKTTSF
jgi:hypothetical protein